MLWTLALWHSLEARALFGDGAAYFVVIVDAQRPQHFYMARDYAMLASQLPMISALLLGVTDLHWLARLQSFGLFALPTVFYHLALVRARDDAVLLAVVIAAIATVFMTMSFGISGEHNTAYAVAILAAILLADSGRPNLVDGLVLVVIATFALRIYEVFVFFGPLFAAKSVWVVRNRPWPIIGFGESHLARVTSLAGVMIAVSTIALAGRYAIFALLGALMVGAVARTVVARAPPFAISGFYLLAAALFVAGAVVAVHSLVTFVEVEKFESLLALSQGSWTNIQFDLALGTFLAVLIWALLRPDDLHAIRPYRWASAGLILLALSPLQSLIDDDAPILLQSNARIVAGPIILIMIVFMWIYRSELLGRPKGLIVLRTPESGRRLAAWTFLVLVALVPSDIVLTLKCSSFLEVMRDSIREHSGPIAFEDTPMASAPYVSLSDGFAITSQSVAMRSKRSDGIVLPARDYTSLTAIDPSQPPDLGRFFWRN